MLERMTSPLPRMLEVFLLIANLLAQYPSTSSCSDIGSFNITDIPFGTLSSQVGPSQYSPNANCLWNLGSSNPNHIIKV